MRVCEQTMSAAGDTIASFDEHLIAPASDMPPPNMPPSDKPPPDTAPSEMIPQDMPPPELLSPQMPPPQMPPPKTAPSQSKHLVHWFRKGLRLHDNPALREGLINAKTFRCVFIIDPWFASSSNVGINKWRFLLQCLKDLDDSLKKLKSRLFVVRGQPADALPKLFREWGTTALTFEEDPEPYGRVRDHNIMSKCREVGITVTSSVSHTLYKLDHIIERNGGKAPLTYHQFQALIASMPAPPAAEPAITEQTLTGVTTPVTVDHDERFGVPTLDELGFETEGLKPPIWIGGETEALARLERHLERKAWVASFGRPKMTPQSLLASQTGLSPYLRFGCLSTRLFYYQLSDLYQRVKHVRPPLSLHGQILWREFFYCAATRNPNFDRMDGNPICVQIPWEKNPEALAKWANGQTGFPWIDSIMIQLREEGWIHHLARHAVACFLTRGDLWISWEEGMKVFDELLLDADWSVNAGMWMWLSCSSFFQQFFHCYCPVRFGRKTDPNGDYIRKYVPILKNMPTRYIHEPWVAPDSVQQSAHCIIGRDYPLPMVDHNKASLINIERIKQVYAQLAKYKPQVNLNAVQRPNISQSSPSPTSIISSMNRSNYLCNQMDADATIFLKPQNKNDISNYRHLDLLKNSRINGNVGDANKQIKQIIILPQIQCAKVTSDNITGKCSYTTPTNENLLISNPLDGSYETVYKINALQSDKQDNYHIKHLIHNYIENCANPQDTCQSKSDNTRVVYSSEHDSNIGNYEKSTFFISASYTENVLCMETSSKNVPTIIVPQTQMRKIYNVEDNTISNEDKNNGGPSIQIMTLNATDESMTYIESDDKEDDNKKFDSV